MERKTKRATLGDVARLSGVSTTTVSYVLNRTDGQTISKPTRLRIENAVRQLGYVPNNAARVLRAGTSNIVLVDVDIMPNSKALDELIRGMEEVLSKQECTLLVHYGHLSSSSLDEVADKVSARAVINLRAPQGDQNADSAANNGGLSIYGALQADHLIERGHSMLAVGIPQDPLLRMLADERALGVRYRLEAAGFPPPLEFEVPAEVEEAARTIVEIRRHHPEVTAVAAYNDDVAVVLLAAARRAGIRVPTDWAVIGVDDSIYAPLSEPALTTIAVDSFEAGRQLAKHALGSLKPEDFHVSPGRVVLRSST